MLMVSGKILNLIKLYPIDGMNPNKLAEAYGIKKKAKRLKRKNNI